MAQVQESSKGQGLPVSADMTGPPLFSADSHVIEDPGLWNGILADGYFGPESLSIHDRPGRVDPVARIEEMSIDGVDGEVLYPSLALGLFELQEAALQERAFERYNSWLIDFCKVNPDRLLGIGLISVYDIDHAIRELERCRREGLSGCQIWQVAPSGLAFSGRHYERFWSAAAALDMPVSLHILTGFRGQAPEQAGLDPVTYSVELFKRSVTQKLQQVSETMLEIIFSGVLDRHPGLKLVFVENEIGWLPFILDQLDYYARRFAGRRETNNSKAPSSYFASQMFATFFRDPVGTKMLGWWGADGCMWSSDYPHPNSTWPNSREVVKENLGYLDAVTRHNITRGTALRLYGRSDTYL